MNREQRPLLAGIIYRILTNDTPQSVYSFDDGKYLPYSGTANAQTICIYDISRNVYVTGYCTYTSMKSTDIMRLQPNVPQLLTSFGRFLIYDYGTQHYITLEASLNSFSGYDYNSNCYYGGSLSGNYISLYDYETSLYHKFAASSMPVQLTAANTTASSPRQSNTLCRLVKRTPPVTLEQPIKYTPPAQPAPEPEPPRPAAELPVADIEKEIKSLEETINAAKENKKAIKDMKKLLKQKLKEEKQKLKETLTKETANTPDKTAEK